MPNALTTVDIIKNIDYTDFSIKIENSMDFVIKLNVPKRKYYKVDGKRIIVATNFDAVKNILEMSESEYNQNTFEHNELIPFINIFDCPLGRGFTFYKNEPVNLDAKMISIRHMIEDYAIPHYYKDRLAYLMSCSYSATKNELSSDGLIQVVEKYKESGGVSKEDYVSSSMRGSLRAPYAVEEDFRFHEILRFIFLCKANIGTSRSRFMKMIKMIKPLIERFFAVVRPVELDESKYFTEFMKKYIKTLHDNQDRINEIKEDFVFNYPFTAQFITEHTAYRDFDAKMRSKKPDFSKISEKYSSCGLDPCRSHSISHSKANQYSWFTSGYIYGQPGVADTSGKMTFGDARKIKVGGIKRIYTEIKWNSKPKSKDFTEGTPEPFVLIGNIVVNPEIERTGYETVDGHTKMVNPKNEFRIICDDGRWRRNFSALENTIIYSFIGNRLYNAKEDYILLPSIGGYKVAFKVERDQEKDVEVSRDDADDMDDPFAEEDEDEEEEEDTGALEYNPYD